MVTVSEEYELSLNINKTKYMIITKTKTSKNISMIYVKNQPIEKVRDYKCVGTTINEINDSPKKYELE